MELDVIGQNTHWNGGTFQLRRWHPGGEYASRGRDTCEGRGQIAPLAPLGAASVTATTRGEVATLAQRVRRPAGHAADCLLSPTAAQQQASVTLTILGQVTSWQDGVTSVSLGPGVPSIRRS